MKRKILVGICCCVLVQICYSKTLQFKNLSGELFWLSIKYYSCDTLFEIPLKRSTVQDSLYDFEESFRNFSVVLLNEIKSEQVSFMIYLDSDINLLEFDLKNQSKGPLEILNSMELKSSGHSTSFLNYFRFMYVSAIQGRELDTSKAIGILKGFIDQRPDNYFACWLLMNIAGDKNKNEYIHCRRLIHDCRFAERYFFPGFGYLNKNKSAPSSISYDTFVDYLNQNCFRDVEHKIHFYPETDTAILIFWATWCGPCVKQISELSLSQKRSKKFYFISVDKDVFKTKTSASKLGVSGRLYFADAQLLEKFGFKYLPLHVKLIRKPKLLLVEE
ncbi:MAG: hypothetical protein H6605_07600 [Flavobacteriales bacterium]|nr:hypothetical protein [Flavobacteriales bacterium]